MTRGEQEEIGKYPAKKTGKPKAKGKRVKEQGADEPVLPSVEDAGLISTARSRRRGPGRPIMDGGPLISKDESGIPAEVSEVPAKPATVIKEQSSLGRSIVDILEDEYKEKIADIKKLKAEAEERRRNREYEIAHLVVTDIERDIFPPNSTDEYIIERRTESLKKWNLEQIEIDKEKIAKAEYSIERLKTELEDAVKGHGQSVVEDTPKPVPVEGVNVTAIPENNIAPTKLARQIKKELPLDPEEGLRHIDRKKKEILKKIKTGKLNEEEKEGGEALHVVFPRADKSRFFKLTKADQDRLWKELENANAEIDNVMEEWIEKNKKKEAENKPVVATDSFKRGQVKADKAESQKSGAPHDLDEALKERSKIMEKPEKDEVDEIEENMEIFVDEARRFQEELKIKYEEARLFEGFTEKEKKKTLDVKTAKFVRVKIQEEYKLSQDIAEDLASEIISKI